jgi:crotonobetainyl-CoA:carnitine CoA-transferase CaiB-like acyl-CoA transferase
VFAPLDCCVTPVLTPAEALAQPQVAARDLRHQAAGATWIGPLAAIGDQRPRAAEFVPPGAHTRAVLAEAGLDAPAIEALFAAGSAA